MCYLEWGILKKKRKRKRKNRGMVTYVTKNSRSRHKVITWSRD